MNKVYGSSKYTTRFYLETKKFKRKCNECRKRKSVAYIFYTEELEFIGYDSPISQYFICQSCGIELQKIKQKRIADDAEKRGEVLVGIPIKPSSETALDVIKQAGYVQKEGELRYKLDDSLGDSIEYLDSQSVKTELFEKEDKLYYFAGVSQCENNQKSVLHLGSVEEVEKYKNAYQVQ